MERQTIQIAQRRNYDGIYNRYIKRIIGLVISVIALIVLSPAFLIISIAVVCESGFPVFYRAPRGGYLGKSFRIFKFRSMVKNADKIGGGTTALNDSRITGVGAFLRKTKLDEIAQLLNIINGTMSFVGPRPELLNYTGRYSGEEKLIFEVRPGITDFSSVEFINLDELVGDSDADSVYEKYVLKRKNSLRVKYANEVSFKTDVRLFVITAFKTASKALHIIFATGEKHGKADNKKF